ncbi:MAG: ImmA/IrrE family metallo-endopeptidase [Lachnospiraceae bacterium]
MYLDNESLEGNERTFVMAHEVGHAVLHPKENCYFLRNQTFLNTRIEQEANAFAAELLISDDAILEAEANRYTIDQLSRILGYEKELIQLRLK